MAKKQWIFLAVFVLLAAFYVCAFTHWGRRPAMQISHTSELNPKRVGPRVKAGSINTAVVIFGLDHQYRLTEVKVVLLADWQTNKSTLPLWHLISDSNSIPVKKFSYGQAMQGMKPAVAESYPEPLEPNVTYRLFLTGGSIKGQHDFSAPPK